MLTFCIKKQHTSFLFLILTVDVTASFNFTMLQVAEDTTVIVCADIISSMTFNVSITFSVANTQPNEISKLTIIIIYVTVKGRNQMLFTLSTFAKKIRKAEIFIIKASVMTKVSFD